MMVLAAALLLLLQVDRRDGVLSRALLLFWRRVGSETVLGQVDAGRVAPDHRHHHGIPEHDEVRGVIIDVDAEFEGDAWFPEIDMEKWREISTEAHSADEKNPVDYRFMIFEKIEKRSNFFLIGHS